MFTKTDWNGIKKSSKFTSGNITHFFIFLDTALFTLWKSDHHPKKNPQRAVLRKVSGATIDSQTMFLIKDHISRKVL